MIMQLSLPERRVNLSHLENCLCVLFIGVNGTLVIPHPLLLGEYRKELT
jgi:hypothetical protein